MYKQFTDSKSLDVDTSHESSFESEDIFIQKKSIFMKKWRHFESIQIDEKEQKSSKSSEVNLSDWTCVLDITCYIHHRSTVGDDFLVIDDTSSDVFEVGALRLNLEHNGQVSQGEEI